MPLISIVIPVYKVEKYLPQCLDSVVNQTCRDLEIICVNDGSPDNCDKILAEYASRDPRIRIVNQANGGLSAARNSGAKVATGKYLYFLDSDDWLDSDAMERCVALAEENHLDEIIFECVPELESPDLDKNTGIYKNDFTCGDVLPGREIFVRTINFIHVLEDGTHKIGSYLPCVWLRFLNRAFYEAKGLSFYDGLIHEDELFSVQCDLQAERVMYLKHPFYHYRIRKNSIMTRGLTFADIRSFGIIYVETLAFLASHPELETEVLDAVRVRQDKWLDWSNHYIKKLPEADIRREIQQDPKLAIFVDFVRLFGRYVYELEVEREKHAATKNSGSYRLGRFLSKILHPWHVFKKK